MRRKEGCNNNREENNRHIIGKTTKCVHPTCQGWLVDTFSHKYWIRCIDSKHSKNLNHKKVERQSQAGNFSTHSSSQSNHEADEVLIDHD
jgi:hypothetical protein